uniref:Uncharacterized protein n=1 Tax=viral metagenome TaxID=1070528 RepID=A0A6H1ZBL8_9ZZZZ
MNDSRQLVKAINKKIASGHFVSELTVAMAATILAINGIEAALEYVENFPQTPPSIEASFDCYLDGQLTKTT